MGQCCPCPPGSQEPPKRTEPVPTTGLDDIPVEILKPEPQIRVKALYEYSAQTPGDLSFAAGEILFLEREDDDGDGWWWCRSAAGIFGFAPSNFVQRLDRGPESLDCWFDVDRQEAMWTLLRPGHGPGTYMLRPCKQKREIAKYTLSVRMDQVDKETGMKKPNVSHYLLHSMDNGGFYISTSKTFDSMAELIEFYGKPNSGLAAPLTQPCPKVWVPPAQFRDFEVDRSRITLKERLGAGSFGEVYKAELGRGQQVAVKKMTEGAMRREEFISEGRTMHKLHHPNIVQLLGVCTRDDPIFIITEFMPNGDLKKYLLKNRDGPGSVNVTFDVMIVMMGQITDGMEYLEQKKVVHRDLRAANILVGHSNVVKVGDFGLTKYLEEDVYGIVEVENKFPVRWTAPEAMSATGAFTTKSDVWSFGIVIYEIVTKGSAPYPNLGNNKEVMDKVGKEKYRMPNPRALKDDEKDDQIYQVMCDCWRSEPEERPTFNRLKDLFADFRVEFEQQYVKSMSLGGNVD